MKSTKPWTSQPIKRATAGLLAGVLFLSAAGCKNKKKKQDSYNKSSEYSSGKEIKESDPYFNAEVFPLDVPVDQNKVLETMFVDRVEYEDGVVIASLFLNYELKENASFEEWEESSSHVTALFDEKGKYITDLQKIGLDIYDVAADIDGNICVLASYNIGMTGTMGAMLSVVDRKGNIVNQIELDNPPVDGNGESWPSLGILPDGRYTVSGLGKMVVYERDGKRAYEIADFDRLIEGSVITQDGKNYVLSTVRGDLGDKEFQIKEVDLKTGKLGEGMDASYLVPYSTPVTTNEGVFVRSGSGCFRCDIKTQNISQIFDWNDTDVSRNLIYRSKIYPLSDDELYAVGEGFSGDNMKASLIHLTRAEKNPHAGKKMLVVGGYDMKDDYALQAFLDEYNKDTTAKARAIVIDYYDGVTNNADLSEIEKQLYLDFLSGTGPDILYGFGQDPTFNNSHVMLDLNTYLDGANGISRDEYFDNILRASEKEGKLYQMPLRYSLYGMEANTKFISNRIGWTYDEFDEAASKIPQNVSFLEASEYGPLLIKLLSNHPGFADYDNKTVNFQNDEMKRLLQMAKKYGVKELPKDEGQGHTYLGDGRYQLNEDLTNAKMKSDLLAVRETYIGNISGYAIMKRDLQGNLAFLGFPSPDGSGMSCDTYSSLGILATCKNPDMAWELIRSFMNYEITDGTRPGGFPIKKSVFESESKAEMEMDNKMYEKQLREMKFTQTSLDYVIQISEEDIDEVRKLITNVTRSVNRDPVISGIISEEAAGYFAGDRTEDEVLSTIQNRTSIVVKEL